MADDKDWEDVPSSKKPASASSDSEWSDVSPKAAPKASTGQHSGMDLDDYLKHPAKTTIMAEPTEENLPGSTPQLRAAVKKGVAPMTPPTQFEQDNPARPKWYGFTPNNIVNNAYEGIKGLATGTAELGKDILMPQGETEGDKLSFLAHKYVTDPAMEQFQKAGEEWDKGGAPGVIAAGGHALAGALPLIGPWAAQRGEQAGTGDIGGALGQTAGGLMAPGAAKEGLKLAKPLAEKVALGTPMTEAGKLEAAKKQAMTVKKPGMNETEYAQRVQAAIPDLQQIAQDNKGALKTPRQSVQAINKRISQLEEPISSHLRTLNQPEDMVHPSEYQGPINAAIDAEFAKDPGQHTKAEIEKAKKTVNEFIGDQPKSLQEIENNRKRLNQDADAYYHSDTAGKNAIDVSDATARAQRAAANQIRNVLYGDENNPGQLEKAGVQVLDNNGQPTNVRALRQRVGNLLELRDHFEDAITKAEANGDWKPFHSLFNGPSLAAGGIGAAAGMATHGPLGALFGTLAGEGGKAWADFLRSKNPNLNVAKMWGNLERTTPQPAPVPSVFNATKQYSDAIGPQIPQHMEPIGPQTAPQPFELQNQAKPNAESLWAQQVGAPPNLETGAPSQPYGKPIGPQEEPMRAPAPIQGEQQELPMGPSTLWDIRQTPGKAPTPSPWGEISADINREAPGKAPAPIGGPGREAVLKPLERPGEIKIGEGEDLGKGFGTQHPITIGGKHVGSVTVEATEPGTLHIHWLGGELGGDLRAVMTELKKQYPDAQKLTYDRRRVAKGANAATTERRTINLGGEGE